jgi:hypothetical protein
MGEIKFDNRIIEIEDVIFWSYSSSLYINPKFFVSFELTDQNEDSDFEVAFDFRHIELDGYQDAKELLDTRIQFNETELNKTLNIEYLNGEELKITSLTFLLSSLPEKHLISGKGTVLNKLTNEINDFQFNSDVSIKQTNHISESKNESNLGHARMELIRSIGDVYNSRGMLNLKDDFPNVHRGYEIIKDWLRCFGTVYQLYQNDYSVQELAGIKELNDLIINFVENNDKDGLSLPEVPEIYSADGWAEIKSKARVTLSSIALKGVHPDFKRVLMIEKST